MQGFFIQLDRPLARLTLVVGLFLPFIGLPISMVAVVSIAAAGIENRRLLYGTVGIVAASVLLNLALVMVALPAGQEIITAF